MPYPFVMPPLKTIGAVAGDGIPGGVQLQYAPWRNEERLRPSFRSPELAAMLRATPGFRVTMPADWSFVAGLTLPQIDGGEGARIAAEARGGLLPFMHSNPVHIEGARVVGGAPRMLAVRAFGITLPPTIVIWNSQAGLNAYAAEFEGCVGLHSNAWSVGYALYGFAILGAVAGTGDDRDITSALLADLER